MIHFSQSDAGLADLNWLGAAVVTWGVHLSDFKICWVNTRSGICPHAVPLCKPTLMLLLISVFLSRDFFGKIMMKLGFPCALLTHELFVLNVKGARSDQKFVLCVTQSSLWSDLISLSCLLTSATERFFAKTVMRKLGLSSKYASFSWKNTNCIIMRVNMQWYEAWGYFKKQNTSRILMWVSTLGPLTDNFPSAAVELTPQCKYCTWIGFVYMWRNEVYMGFTVNTLSVVVCLEVYEPVGGLWKLKQINTSHLLENIYFLGGERKEKKVTLFCLLNFPENLKSSFYYCRLLTCTWRYEHIRPTEIWMGW